MEPRSRLLGNRYELLVPLASGGMGRVWRARDTLLERPVAVKVLRSEFTGDATFRARFRAEAQHTAALHHPNIASVFDYGELQEDGENLAYLVMELVEGETLSALLEREGRLDAPRTLDVLRQTSAALAAAHAAGVVHRDIKPGNVLVRPDGVVKITDFGIAWSASSVPLTGTGQVVGTAHYLSPEQAAGAKATPASDVYALGAVAYECLAGRRAFDGENSVQIALMQIRDEPRPLPSDVPPAVRALVERAMAKDPAVRFPDGAALGSAVDRAADGSTTAPIATAGPHGTAVLPVVAAPADAPAAPARGPEAGRASRSPRLLLVGAIAAAVLVALVVALLQLTSPAGNAEQPPAEETSEAPAPPSVVTVVAADLVGRPVDDVQAELEAQDLQVQTVPVETGEVPAGQVTAVSPTGEVALGSVVTVSYAVQPPPPPVEQGNGNGGQGNGGNGNEGGGNGNEGNQGGGNGDEGGGNGDNGNGNGNGDDQEGEGDD